MITVKRIDNQKDYEQHWQELQLHILQSWEWGEVKKGEWVPIRLGFYEDKKLLALMSLQVRSFPFVAISFAYIPKAIIRQEFQEPVLNALAIFAKDELGLAFLLFDFDMHRGLESRYLKSLVSAGHTIQPQWSNQIMLNGRSEEDLLKAMDGKHRRNIKKSLRENVSVKQYDQGDKALDAFADVMTEVIRNTKYVMSGKQYFRKVWETLNESGKAKIFIAERQQEVVGAYLIVYDALGAYELYGGVTGKGRDCEAGYLLKWEAIRDALNTGKSLYDHWGIAQVLKNGEYDEKHELFRISKFKEGFGGQVVEFIDEKVVILTPLAYKAFKIFQGSNAMLLKTRKLIKMFS